MMGAVSGAFLIAGALLTMIGGIGVVRFDDLMSRRFITFNSVLKF